MVILPIVTTAGFLFAIFERANISSGAFTDTNEFLDKRCSNNAGVKKMCAGCNAAQRGRA